MAMRARQARLGTACKGLSRHRLPLTKLDAFICLVLFVILFKFLFLLAISTNTSGAMCQQQRPAHQASRRSPLEPVAPGSIFDSLLGMSSNKQQQETANQNGNQAAQSNFNDITHMSYRNGQTSDKVTLPGDILLGGLFPIHMKGELAGSSERWHTSGVLVVIVIVVVRRCRRRAESSCASRVDATRERER